MKHIIFDFDGVLTTDSVYLQKFLSKTIPFCSLKKAKEIVVNTALENKKNRGVSKLIRLFGSSLFLKFLKEREENLKLVNIKKDILQWVKLAKDKGVKSHLITSNYLEICTFLLGDSVKDFDNVISFSEVDSKSEGINKLVNMGKVEVRDCVFITDTQGDIKEILKFTSPDKILAVTWGFHDSSYFSSLVPDINIISSSEELIVRLNKIISNFDKSVI